MLKRLFSRNRPSPVPQELYGRVVAQSRDAAFYANAGVPDTVTGRFDMLCLHAFLLTRRLSADPAAHARELSQDFFDIFSSELDAALREIGVGDTSVPKRLKRMMGAYYALVAILGEPLDADDGAQAGNNAAARFAPGSAVAPAFFSAYLPAAAGMLADTDYAELARGNLEWPAPAQFVTETHEQRT